MPAYSFKRRFVDPIRCGLGLPVDEIDTVVVRPKLQTIRAIGKRRHALPDETVQLYHGMRTKQCFKIGEGRCNRFEGIFLKWSEWRSFALFDVVEREPGVWRRKGDLRPIEDLDAFAVSDGFSDFDDMAAFWREEHGPASFEGAVIGWEPRA